jgi:hypothetical protein
MVSQSVSDYFNDATQALSDASTALSNLQTWATSALATTLSDLTSSNAQLRTDATDAYNQAVAESSDAYTNARNAAFAAWNDTTAAAIDMATNANNANADAVADSVNAIANLDSQFADITNAMVQADTDISNQQIQIGSQTVADIANHGQQWLEQWMAKNDSVGQPGPWELWIPIWGSGRAAIDDFQNGNYGWAAFNTAMAISDVFLVKSIMTGVGKGLIKLSGFSWSNVRRWLTNKGFAVKGQPVHHCFIPQGGKSVSIWAEGWGRYIPNWIKNQPLNLKPMSSKAWHDLAHGKGPYKYFLPWPTGALIAGTPMWSKAMAFSTFGRLLDMTRIEIWMAGYGVYDE